MSVKPWTKLNCYETLRIEATASDPEIRKAFKVASQQAHPDRGGSHEAQIRVNLAYEILTKPELRQQHDRHWKLGKDAGKPISPYFSGEDAVKNLWSGPGGGAPKLSDGRASSGLTARVKARLQRDRDRMTLDRENRAELWRSTANQNLKRARWEGASLTGAFLLCSAVGSLYPLTFLGSATLAFPLLKRLRGRWIEGREPIALWDPRAQQKLSLAANQLAQEWVERDRARLEIHVKTLDFLSHAALTPARASDSEATVVRKFLTVLFVLGLVPQRLYAQEKQLVLASESETALLCFRHGANRALSLAAVEKIIASRTQYGAKTIYLYNQGGLSKKAGECANRANIRWVGLQELNAWAKQVWSSESSGPGGDILQRLVEFRAFLDQHAL